MGPNAISCFVPRIDCVTWYLKTWWMEPNNTRAMFEWLYHNQSPLQHSRNCANFFTLNNWKGDSFFFSFDFEITKDCGILANFMLTSKKEKQNQPLFISLLLLFEWKPTIIKTYNLASSFYDFLLFYASVSIDRVVSFLSLLVELYRSYLS